MTWKPSPSSAVRADPRLSLLRELIETRAPSAANARAHAKPMPLVPPVMNTTLPSNPSRIFFLFLTTTSPQLVTRPELLPGAQRASQLRRDRRDVRRVAQGAASSRPGCESWQAIPNQE